jgi:hypothetical protein
LSIILGKIEDVITRTFSFSAIQFTILCYLK